MNIKNKLKKYQESLNPSRRQEEMVYMKIFGEMPKESYKHNFLNILSMKSLMHNKVFLAVFSLVLVFVVIGTPITYMALFKGSAELDTNTQKTTGTSVGNSTNELKTAAPTANYTMLQDGNDTSTNQVLPDVAMPYIVPQPGASEDTTTPEALRLKEKSAYFTLNTADIQSVFNEAKTIASQVGGYVTTSNYYGDSTSTLIFRVPADKFDVAVEKVHGLNATVSIENITTNDKQNEFSENTQSKTDLESKIKDLQSKLNNETDQAKKSDLTYQIQDLQNQLDGINAQLKNITNDTSFSTIQINFKSAGLVILGGDFKDLATLAKTIVIFWAQVALYLSVPIIILIIIYKLIKRSIKK